MGASSQGRGLFSLIIKALAPPLSHTHTHSVPFGVVVRIWMRGSFSDWAPIRSPFSLPPSLPPPAVAAARLNSLVNFDKIFN